MSGMFRLDGQVAVVTGGGSGLGLAIAEGLAAHGASVVIAGRNQQRLDDALPAVQQQNPDAARFAADVSREEDVVALDAFAAERFGRVDVLVNCAGINPFYRSAEHTPLSEWRQIVDVNLTGVFLCCTVFGRRMLAQGSGSIVNITSVAGHVGLAKSAAYCAAKGGVELMTRSLALDWAAKGVRVNTIAPGYFETDMTSGLREHAVLGERLRGKTPLGRFGVPSEVAGAAIYLAARASSYVTGQSILVDGGWTAG